MAWPGLSVGLQAKQRGTRGISGAGGGHSGMSGDLPGRSGLGPGRSARTGLPIYIVLCSSC
eukprot:scaffold29360_cov33-Prasinocladus_malaysianus.AAC.1